MSSIDNFKAQIANELGPINPNRFRVTFAPKISFTGVEGIKLNDLDERPTGGNHLVLQPETVQIPGSQIGSFENQTFRNPTKYPNIRTYEDVSMVFPITRKFSIVKFFKQWHDQIVSKDDWTVAYRDDYAVDLLIEQLDRNDNVVFDVTLENAWPVGVNSLDLDAAGSDVVSKIAVTFTYEKFKDSSTGNSNTSVPAEVQNSQ